MSLISYFLSVIVLLNILVICFFLEWNLSPPPATLKARHNPMLEGLGLRARLSIPRPPRKAFGADCPECGTHFSLRSALEKHLVQHSSQLPMVAQPCQVGGERDK